MTYFLLRSNANDPVWDNGEERAYGFVVRAETAQEARRWASEQCGDEGAPAWLEPAHSTCEALPIDGPAGIVIRDYWGG